MSLNDKHSILSNLVNFCVLCGFSAWTWWDSLPKKQFPDSDNVFKCNKFRCNIYTCVFVWKWTSWVQAVDSIALTSYTAQQNRCYTRNLRWGQIVWQGQRWRVKWVTRKGQNHHGRHLWGSITWPIKGHSSYFTIFGRRCVTKSAFICKCLKRSVKMAAMLEN